MPLVNDVFLWQLLLVDTPMLVRFKKWSVDGAGELDTRLHFRLISLLFEKLPFVFMHDLRTYYEREAVF